MTFSPGNPQLRGIVLMVLAVGIFSLLDTAAKYLSRWYAVGEIVWARYAVNLLLLLVYFASTGRLRHLRTGRLRLQLVRGVMLGSATLLYFTSLTRLRIADAAAIGLVLPLFVAILAVPMLKERLDMPRLLAVLAGLAGALVIVRPGSGVFTLYALLPMAMALCNALYQILTRKLSGIEHPMTSLFYGALIGTLMFSPMLPSSWQTPLEPLHWALFALLGHFGLAGHLALIRAYEHASAGLLAPFHYSQLLWVIVLGLSVFGELPDGWSFIGMAIIVTAGMFLVNRQRLAVHRQE